jgi:phage repressor protein C with HTH and peptisase S24 domain
MSKTTNLEIRYLEFAARVKQAMEMAKCSMSDLSRLTNIRYEMIRRYAMGSAMPRAKKLLSLAEALGVTPEWLQFGCKSDLETLPSSSNSDIFEEDTNISNHIEILRYDVDLSTKEENSFWIVRENSDDPIVFSHGWFKRHQYNPDLLKGMYVRGDSMEPELHNGDTVIINTDDTEILDGEIYAIIFKNKLYIKELRQSEDGILIISKNSEYPPMEVTANTFNQFIVLGKKIWRGG